MPTARALPTPIPTSLPACLSDASARLARSSHARAAAFPRAPRPFQKERAGVKEVGGVGGRVVACGAGRAAGSGGGCGAEVGLLGDREGWQRSFSESPAPASAVPARCGANMTHVRCGAAAPPSFSSVVSLRSAAANLRETTGRLEALHALLALRRAHESESAICRQAKLRRESAPTER